MFGDSIISKTGQMWKLMLSFALLLAGWLALAWGVSVGDSEYDPLVVSFVVGGMTTAILGLLFAIVSIRCPKCRKRWFWQAVNGQASGNWLSWILSRSECPKCHD